MPRGTTMQSEDANGTSRGSPRARYGVSFWRCATQPQAVSAVKVRAPPTIAPGNSASARSTAAAQPGIGTASASRKTTASPRASSQPRLRAPPANPRVSVQTTRAPNRFPIAAVASVEASSTTITSCGGGSSAASAASTDPSVRWALYAGMTTLIAGTPCRTELQVDDLSYCRALNPVSLALPRPRTRRYSRAAAVKAVILAGGYGTQIGRAHV